MRFKLCFLILALTAAMPAFAQTAAVPDGADCRAEEASLERDIDLARSRGQMLRRQQLAETLNAVRERCKTTVPSPSRAARIDRLEQEVRSLRAELDRAEAQLRQLKSESP
jgi:hypothetical protein